MLEAPRLSSALRAKQGLRPVSLDQQLLNRKREYDAIYHPSSSTKNSSSSSSSKSSASASTTSTFHDGTLSWSLFAGPFHSSNETHVRTVRETYNEYLHDVAELLGPNTSSIIVSTTALQFYVALWKSFQAQEEFKQKGIRFTEIEERRLWGRVRSELRTDLSLSQYRTFLQHVLTMQKWRRQYTVQPPLDSTYLDTLLASSSTSVTTVIPGFYFKSLDSVLSDSSSSSSIFHTRYGPLQQILEPEAFRRTFDTYHENADDDDNGDDYEDDYSSSSILETVAKETQAEGPFDALWLISQTGQYIAQTSHALGLVGIANALYDTIKQNYNKSEKLQQTLYDTLGDSGIEFMMNIISNVEILATIPVNEFRQTLALAQAQQKILDGHPLPSSSIKERNRPIIGSGVSVTYAADKLIEKGRQRAERRFARQTKNLANGMLTGAAILENDTLTKLGFSPDYIAVERALGLQGGEPPLPTYGSTQAIRPKNSNTNAAATSHGLISVEQAIASANAGYGGVAKRVLPEGTTDTTSKEGIREVVVPATKPSATGKHDNLVKIADMDPLAQQAFIGIDKLNRLQSELFEGAYHSNENLLVCAPTGAGKTNVAMLTVCRELLRHVTDDGKHIRKDDEFKIIYVAPMKALAQEVVSKFGQRLSGLGLVVRELTGDMQLTKKEISETHVIVTTPEKWDVITRKAGDASLVSLVRLLIIDEVHLLADDRGAVIESIVARTLRLVETSQSIIRIVGLSATLPNYQDVALFLRVNPTRGLFYFDSSYRPVPLQQTFIGVNEKNALKRVNFMNQIAWNKAIAAVRRGKQVMVFVHSRKDTGKTARTLRDLANAEGAGRLLSPFGEEEAEDADAIHLAKPLNTGNSSSTSTAAITNPIQGEGRVSLNHHQWVGIQNEVEKSRNQELRELFQSGFGIHHAGMLRSDRNLTERMFNAGVIKILCCTATLAWGVNLPAHTVIIKGTEVYDAEGGKFSDLGMLDVMQIFGRAGRPQFDTSGEGIIITGGEKVDHYLSMLTSQIPIESSFIRSLPDHLNAEIVSGTVTNIREAVAWLSYTYLYVRMLRNVNPLMYGITREEKMKDPLLEGKRVELIKKAADTLNECKMIRYDVNSGNFAVTDLGRVASHYYVVNETVSTFNDLLDKAHINSMNALNPHKPEQPVTISTHLMSSAVELARKKEENNNGAIRDEDLLDLICRAHEFTQIKVRDEEVSELDYLRTMTQVKVKGDPASTVGKVNVLLQCFIGNIPLRSFTLISDTAYITQSAGRLSRALFEICLHKHWCTLAERMLTLSKAIDKRLWWTVSPLRQFPWSLDFEIIRKLENTEYDITELADMDPNELGALIRHPKLGSRVSSMIQQVPRLDIETIVQPVSRSILRLTVTIYPYFHWNDRISGTAEPFWIWVEDAQSDRIYHTEYLLLQKRQVLSGEPLKLSFVIPIFEPIPTQYWLRCESDRWLGIQSMSEISFRHLILPTNHPPHTKLLDLLPLPVHALRNKDYENLYAKSFTHFNPVQTQMFFTVYNTDANVLLGAPTGSGKTVAAELAVFRLLSAHPGQKAVYIAPLKALVTERLRDWQRKFGEKLGKKVVELTGDVTPDAVTLKTADIIITTPEKWDGITRFWYRRNYVTKVGLIILDEIHLLGEERGPVLEVIVSRMRYIASRTGLNVRFMGLSTALANAHDLADWLGIDGPGLFNFRPSVRPIPMEVHLRGFPGKHYCPRMATMNKPTFAAITTYSPDNPVLVFVASRRQTRLTALDLIALCATAENPKRFLRMSDEEVAELIEDVRDTALQHTLAFGIGIHHAGLCESDRVLVEELFVKMKIQVLICTSTLAWGVNFPARLVVIKGTEYYDAKSSRYVDFPVTDVLQMMGRAGRPQYDDKGIAVVMVHEPKKNFYSRFLYDPFPVESQLRHQLDEHINAEIAGGAIRTRHDAVEYLTWTYFFRRLLQNPTYYEVEDATPEGIRNYLYTVVDEIFTELEECGCIYLGDDAVEALTDELENDDGINTSKVRGGLSSLSPDDAVAPTTIGTITSYYYLHHTTAAMFVDTIPNSAVTVEALARLLTSAPEFSELPVRHNEDELNERFAQNLPWKVPGNTFNSPHTKAYLLLQARFDHIPLPIPDYINDTKSVMDQALRVSSAFMDIAGDIGAYEQTLGIAHLIQCIVQARMPDEHEFFQLPHITSTSIAELEKLLPPVSSSSSAVASSLPYTLSPLQRLQGIKEETIRNSLHASGLSPSNINDCLRVFRGLPFVSMNVHYRTIDGSNTTNNNNIAPASFRLGDEIILTVNITVPVTMHRRVYAPRYNRPKEYGWWIIVGTANNRSNKQELLALKRISLSSTSHNGTSTNHRISSHDVSILLSENGMDSMNSSTTYPITVWLLTDSMHGLDIATSVNIPVQGVPKFTMETPKIV